MKFLDSLLPTKEVVYQTSLSPQKVIQRIESKISSEPKRKSIFDRPPLTYHGKIEGDSFEIGRRSRGNKDHPPTAYGIVEENSNNPLETVVGVTILPNHNFKTGMILFIILVCVSCLPAIWSFMSSYYDSIGFFIFLPIFFSLGFLMNYLMFLNYNKKLAKDIQQLIDGKIIK
ncbi:hypothetical protein V9L05_11875 [Bernardetia sp. Wsw4-3y2]|uniref:hypothetical protein n=1 Tax=Bernardetia sp. Wsw4-3y2 TaxID=3127471 RepID=UPI0030D466FF